MILDLNAIIRWRERNNPNQRKHFELIDGTKRMQMKKETTPNSPVCIWSFTSLIAFIALTLLINLRLLMILKIPMVLILLRLLMFAAFRINMWTWAKERRLLTHRLCSRIVDDEPQGYSALDWEKILHGHAADLGEYKELAVLPDKICTLLVWISCWVLCLPWTSCSASRQKPC